MNNYLDSSINVNSAKFIEVYDEIPFWSAPFGLKLLNNINYKKAIQALDIGFGTGFPLTELAMRLGKESIVYGIDPWENALKRVEKKIIQYNISNVELIHGFSENIPLASNSIELIVSNNGINNVQDLSKSLAECSRVIKKGGQFIQSMNLNSSMHEFYDVMECVLIDMQLTSCIEQMHTHIWKKRKPLGFYLKHITDNGFQIENVVHDKFEYTFTDGTALLNHYFIRLAFLSDWKNIVPKEHQSEVFTRIESKLNTNSLHDHIRLTIPFVIIDTIKI